MARISTTRKWFFRLIACGVPALLGLIAIVAILVSQKRLVIDPDEYLPTLQPPPIYLEEPGHEITGHRYIYDSTLGWRNIPGWESTSFNHKLTINSKGLRDREHPYESPPGIFRILALGDSYTWGYGVADDEIFTQVLESRLLGGQPSWEVINAGVSGWGTDQEYLFLMREGFKYSPQVVVLALFLVNDLTNNMSPKQYGLNKPVFLDTDLELANTPVPLPGEPGPDLDIRANAYELTFAIIERMAQECLQRNCRLVVMKFGRFLFPENPMVLEVDEVVKNYFMTKDRGVYFLDMDDRYIDRGISTQSILEGNDDGHWNAYGHQVTAEILQKYLLESGLLKS